VTAKRDFSTLKVIKDYRGISPDGDLDFGVYASVVEPGTVRVGDELALL
jgi:MOSC domain-containing protein YiiM